MKSWYYFSYEMFAKNAFCELTNEDIDLIMKWCKEGASTSQFMFSHIQSEYYIMHRGTGLVVSWFVEFGLSAHCNEVIDASELRAIFLILKADILEYWKEK